MSGLSGKGADSELNYEYGLVVTILSTCFFWIAGKICDKSVPNAAKQRNYAWRWRNISVSLVHSTLSGAWAVLWLVIAYHNYQQFRLQRTVTWS